MVSKHLPRQNVSEYEINKLQVVTLGGSWVVLSGLEGVDQLYFPTASIMLS